MKNFLKDTCGNIAINTALLGIPLMLSAGAALDYSQYARKESSLQNVTDSAALAVALDLQKSTQEEIETKVDNFFKANLSAEQYLELQDFEVIIPPNKEKVTVVAKGKHPTSLMRIVGINNLAYQPHSVVSAPTGNAEVMMVLDTTGSMSLDGKIDGLKISARKFVEDVLASNATRERVKIGIVPFARYVNVGLDNRNAPWIDVADDYMETTTEQKQDVISSSDCTQATSIDDEGLQKTDTNCASKEYGPTYEQDVTKEYKWNGCVGSRNYPLNLNDADYNNQRVPGPLNTRCPNRITQLTDNETTLKTEINALQTSGSTYIPTGLVWGLRALSDGEPFSDGVSYADAESNSVQKIIVLMTDGENQSSVNSGNKAFHNGKNLIQANQYTREVCNNIKDNDIQIFTIGFGTTIPQATVDLLKECSTDGSNYYNAADGAALTDAFSNITTKLANLYLSE